MSNSERYRNTRQQAIELIQALIDGKTVQYKLADARWVDACPASPNLVPGFQHAEYRVKPEPKINWFVVRKDGTQACNEPYATKRAADDFAARCNLKLGGIGAQCYMPYTVTSFEVKE